MNLSEQLQERYGKSHLSYSSLKQALGDMAQFDRYMKGELKYKSDALDFGTLYDMPKRFEKILRPPLFTIKKKKLKRSLLIKHPKKSIPLMVEFS